MIRLYVYWLENGSVLDIKKQWEDVGYPKGEAFSISQLNSELRGTWWEIELADLVFASEDTVVAVSKFVSLPTSGI